MDDSAVSEAGSDPPPLPEDFDDEQMTLDEMAELDETGGIKAYDDAGETSIKKEEDGEGEDGDWKQRGWRKVGGPDAKEADAMDDDEDDEVAYEGVDGLSEDVFKSIEKQVAMCDKGAYAANRHAICMPRPWPAACKDGSQLYMVVCFQLDPTAAERVLKKGTPPKVAIAGDQTAEVDGVPVLQGMRFHILCGILLHATKGAARSEFATMWSGGVRCMWSGV